MNVFEHVYRTNAWNGVESLSGPGSGTVATQRVAPAILGVVSSVGARSVLDVGCGDGFWMPDLPGYLGVDAAPTAIDRARLRHPERRYAVLDAARDPLPTGHDLVIVRDAIQHLSIRDGLALLANVRGCGASWLLASTYEGGENADIASGVDAYSPDLSAPPFFLGRPARTIPDGYTYHDASAIRDPRKTLGLWALR